MPKSKILIIHGPNLNLLGVRETAIYGLDNLAKINDEISKLANDLNLSATIFQSNSEGEIISKIHTALDSFDGIIINAGAYSHYSHAIADAISAVRKPCIEVHLSNIFAREEFRSRSVISSVCAGVICGFGKNSYLLALKALTEVL